MATPSHHELVGGRCRLKLGEGNRMRSDLPFGRPHWAETNRSATVAVQVLARNRRIKKGVRGRYSLFRTSTGLLLAAFIVCDPIIMKAISKTTSIPASNSAICTGA